MDQPDGHGASTSSQTDQQVVTIDERGVEVVNEVRTSTSRKSRSFTQLTIDGKRTELKFDPMTLLQNVDQKRFFSIMEYDETIKQAKVQCNFVGSSNEKCGSTFTITKVSASNLNRHLKNVHKFGSESKLKSLPLMSIQGNKYERTNPHQRRFDKHLLYLISEGFPFSIVDHPGFQILVHELDPKITVKSRTSFAKRLKNVIKTEVEPALTKSLRTIPDRQCHISCDIWSTRRREGLLGIRCHFIDAEWSQKSILLKLVSLKDSHTAENIKDAFELAMLEYGRTLDMVGIVVTDNGSNMLKAFQMVDILGEFEAPAADTAFLEGDEEDNEELSEGEDGSNDDITSIDSDVDDHDDGSPPAQIDGHVPCASHTLQLSINECIKKSKEATRFYTYVHSVMVFFKRSVKWSDKLKKLTKLDVILPGPTRWNAMLDVLKRFHTDEFFSSVKSVLEEAQVTRSNSAPQPPSQLDKLKAKELYEVLQPLGVATDQLQGDGLTSNIILLSIVSAFKRLVDIQDETQYFKDLVKFLLLSCKSRFEEKLSLPDYFLPSVLDPRQKLKLFSYPWNHEKEMLLLPSRSKVVDTLKFRMVLLQPHSQQSEDSVESSVGSPAQSKKRKTGNEQVGSMFDIMRAIPDEVEQNCDETDIYLREPVAPENINPLEYWKVNSTRFPILSSLAKGLLAFPASSGSIERTFSIAGALQRARRARIKSKTMENLIKYREFCYQDVLVKMKKVRAHLVRK